MSGEMYDKNGANAARSALFVILGEEFDTVMGSGDVDRIAKRLKSN